MYSVNKKPCLLRGRGFTRGAWVDIKTYPYGENEKPIVYGVMRVA